MATLEPQDHYGNILMTPGGQIAGECCCNPTTGCGTNTCGSTGCTSMGIPIQCPQMCLRVFNAGYGGGNINWCGLTWTQAEVQTGDVKPACPNVYTKFQATTIGGGGTYFKKAENLWLYSGTTGLRLWRINSFVSVTFLGPIQHTGKNALTIDPSPAGLFRDQKVWNFLATPTTTSTVYSDLNKILGVAAPTYSNYAITPEFFGSFSTGGVEYSWFSGEGW